MTMIICFAPGTAVSSLAAETTGITYESGITSTGTDDFSDDSTDVLSITQEGTTGATSDNTIGDTSFENIDEGTSGNIENLTDEAASDNSDDLTDDTSCDNPYDTSDNTSDESIFDDDAYSSDDETDLSDPETDSLYDEEVLLDTEFYLASEADSSQEYNLYVGGVQVTGANKDDITSAINEFAQEEVATGEATYDPDTKTMTIKNFVFNGSGYEAYAGGYPECAAVWANIDDFVLNIEGDNTIAEAGGSRSTSTAVFSNSNMIIKGSGTLTAKGGTPTPRYDGHGHSCGLNSYGNLLFDTDFTGTLKCTSEALQNNIQTYVTYALCGGSITVQNGTIIAQAGKAIGTFGLSMGILANGINVYGGNVYASGGDIDNGTESYGIYAPTTYAHFYGGEVKASGKTVAIPHCRFDGNETVYASVNEDGSDSEAYSESKRYQYKYLNVSFVEIFYDLYVGGVHVSNKNRNNLVSEINSREDSDASGLITYNPTTNTINLTDATITGKGESDTWEGIKYIGSDTFNIIAEGDNCIEDKGTRHQYSAGCLFGVYNDYMYFDKAGDVYVNVAEGGKLIFNGGSVSGDTYPSSFGFCYQGFKNVKFSGGGDITLIGASVDNGYSYGINACDIDVDMEGALNALGSDAYYSTGISANSITVKSGTVSAESGTAYDSFGMDLFKWTSDKGLNVEGGKLSVTGGICSGEGYGIRVSSGYKTNITNGELTVSTLSGQNYSSAWNLAPEFHGMFASASKNSDGSQKEEYDPEKNASYKWYKAPDWGEIPNDLKDLFWNDLGNVPAGLWFVFGNDDVGFNKFYTSEDTSIDYKTTETTYTGQTVRFDSDVNVYHGTRRLWNNRDYTIAYKNNINASTRDAGSKAPVITISGKGNYSKNVSFAFDISPRDISEAKLNSPQKVSVNIGAKLSSVKPNLTFAGKNLSLGKDFAIYCNGKELDANSKAEQGGIYTFSLRGKGNFRDYFNESIYVYAVNPKEKAYTLMSKAKITLPKATDMPYDKNGYNIVDLFDNRDGRNPKATVTIGKTVLVYGKDFNVSSPDAYYGKVYDAGKYTIRISGVFSNTNAGMEGYVGDKNATIEIGGIPAGKVKVAGLATSVDYAGKAFELADLFNDKDKTLKEGWTEVTLFSGDTVLEKSKEYDVYMNNNGSFGKFTVEFRLKGGYTGSIKKTVNVKQGNLSAASISAGDAEYSKTGAIPDTVIVKLGSAVLTEGIDYTLSYKNNTKITTPDKPKSAAVVTAKGIGNFKGSVSGTFNVNKADIAECVELVAADKVYNSNAKTGYFKSEPKLQDGGKNISVGKNKDIEPIDKKTAFKYYIAGTDTEIPEDTRSLDPNTVVEVRINVTCSELSPYKAGNYELKGCYKIINKGYDIKSAKVTVLNPQKLVFNNGKEVVLLEETDIQVKMGNTVLGTQDYEIVNLRKNRFLGTATAVIKGKGQYGGTKSFSFKITAKPIK